MTFEVVLMIIIAVQMAVIGMLASPKEKDDENSEEV